MFTTSADLTDLPTVAPNDEVIGFVGMAVLAVSLGLLSMDATTGFAVFVAYPAVAATAVVVGVFFAVRMTLGTMSPVLLSIHRASHILRERFRSIQMTRFDATPMRACNTALAFGSSVMAKVINSSIWRNRSNPVVVSPSMSKMDRAIATTRAKLSIPIWIHITRPFQAAVREAASFNEKASLMVTLNLHGNQRISMPLPTGVVLAAPAPSLSGFIATLDRTIHRRKSITRLVIGGQHE